MEKLVEIWESFMGEIGGILRMVLGYFGRF